MKNYSNCAFYSACVADDVPQELADFLANNLPHGSGIDYDWNIKYLNENESNEFVIATNHYHAMDEFGGYCCVYPFEFIIPLRNGMIDFDGNFDIAILRDGCEFCYCDDDYLYEVIYWSLKDAQNG